MALTTLANTKWYFKSSLNTSQFLSTTDFNVNFNFNENFTESSTVFSFYLDLNEIDYNTTSGGETVYSITTNSWENDKYRYVQFINGDSIEDPVFINWVFNNARQIDNLIDLHNSSWYFNLVPSFSNLSYTEYNINFTANDITFKKFVIGNHSSQSSVPTMIQYQDNSGNGYDAYINGTWNTDYRHIDIIDGTDIDNLSLKLGLTDNATSWNPSILTYNMGGLGDQIAPQVVNVGDITVKPTNPVAYGYNFDKGYQDSECTIDFVWGNTLSNNTTIYANWILNVQQGCEAGVLKNNIELLEDSMFNLNFICNGKAYNKLYIDTSGIILYNNNNATTVYTSSFVNNGYKTLIFSLAPTGILLTGLQANGYNINYKAEGGFLDSALTLPTSLNLTTNFNVNNINYNTIRVQNSQLYYDNTAVYNYSTNTGTSNIYRTLVFKKRQITDVLSWLTLNGTKTSSTSKLYFTVSFNMHNHGTQIAAESIEENTTAVKPDDPSEENYVFGGWYNESTYLSEYNGRNIVTDDIELHAKWTRQYKFNFDMQGHGTQIPQRLVNEGTSTSRPDDPTAANVHFVNWYIDDEYTAVYNFNNVVQSDTTVYAKWVDVLPTHTVSFNMMGHGTEISQQTVDEGQTATRPTNPTDSKFIFNDWYSNKECTQLFNFSTPIMVDTILYAKGTEKTKGTVTFQSDHGSAIASQEVHDGLCAMRPVDPEDPNYEFKNWYTTSGYTTEFNFNTPITQNTTIYAKGEYISETYYVYFNMEGHGSTSQTPSTLSVKRSKRAQEPTNKIKKGNREKTEAGAELDWIFKNGYVGDAEGKEKFSAVYNFNNPVTANVYLYALWEQPMEKTRQINRILIKRGEGVPPVYSTTNKRGLKSYELGWDTTNKDLYIGENNTVTKIVQDTKVQTIMNDYRNRYRNYYYGTGDPSSVVSEPLEGMLYFKIEKED